MASRMALDMTNETGPPAPVPAPEAEGADNREEKEMRGGRKGDDTEEEEEVRER